MLQYAFVIKNFSPISYKVTILHSKHGKINCIYTKNDQAILLTIGSLIVCDIEYVRNRYIFSYLDIVYSPITQDIESLEFIHQIMLICLKMLPENIQVDDVFNFLIDVYKKNNLLTVQNKKLIFLRLFFLSEIFEQNVQLYKIVMQDPFIVSSYDSKILDRYLEVGFYKLFHQKNLEI